MRLEGPRFGTSCKENGTRLVTLHKTGCAVLERSEDPALRGFNPGDQDCRSSMWGSQQRHCSALGERHSNSWPQQRTPLVVPRPFISVLHAGLACLNKRWLCRFGLSYATFTLGPTLSLSTAKITTTDAFTAELSISSDGPAGKVVVQIYATHPSTSGRVSYQYTLLCFAKVSVPSNSAGAAAKVECEASDLESYDTNSGQYIVPKGRYTLTAAQNAGELPKGPTASLQLVGASGSAN